METKTLLGAQSTTVYTCWERMCTWLHLPSCYCRLHSASYPTHHHLISSSLWTTSGANKSALTSYCILKYWLDIMYVISAKCQSVHIQTHGCACIQINILIRLLKVVAPCSLQQCPRAIMLCLPHVYLWHAWYTYKWSRLSPHFVVGHRTRPVVCTLG